MKTRIEHDLLGEKEVPADAYYGIQTLRGIENFQNISGITIGDYPNYVKALAMVKWAAAKANQELEILPDDIANAITRACEEIIGGKLHDQFPVDLIQGGAGTSTNMNINEVVANRALELMGHQKVNTNTVTRTTMSICLSRLTMLIRLLSSWPSSL